MWTGTNRRCRNQENSWFLRTLFGKICSLAGLLLVFSMSNCLQAADQPATSTADGWGSLKGRIVLEGEVPKAELLEITRDEEVCGTFGLRDESLMVNPSTKGIRHLFIWLESREPVDVHPDLEQAKRTEFELDNRDCRFEPHSMLVRTGVPVLIRNSDPVAHNAAIAVRRNQPFSEIVPAGNPLKKTFSKSETMPIQVSCSIHAWMRSWMLILDHPYAVITNQEGEFELKNVPAGKWKFRFWHERCQWIKDLNADGKRTPLEKGAWEITIPADGEVNLGTMEAPSAQFKLNKR